MKDLTLEQILRYVLAGGATIIAAAIAFKEPTVPGLAFGASLAGYFGLALIVGSIIYVFHRVFLYLVCYCILVQCHHGIWTSVTQLDHDRWRRLNDKKSFQRHMSEWAAQVHYLYCLAWGLFAAGIGGWVLGWQSRSWRGWLILSAVLVLAVAIFHHWRYLRQEKFCSGKEEESLMCGPQPDGGSKPVSDLVRRETKMTTRRPVDWWIPILVTLGFIALLGLQFTYLDAKSVQTVVLAATGLIVLWYTIETTRLRREAEARAAKDREPRIYFNVQQPDQALPGSAQTSGPTEFASAGRKHILRFNFINQSPNPALAVVRVRLKIGDQVGTLPGPESAYNGKTVWEITPFFRISGVFDVIALIQSTQTGLGKGAWPVDPMKLVAQVDLYWPDRRHFEGVAKEFHVRADIEKCVVDFWPEVNAGSLPTIQPTDPLPEGPTRSMDDPSA